MKSRQQHIQSYQNFNMDQNKNAGSKRRITEAVTCFRLSIKSNTRFTRSRTTEHRLTNTKSRKQLSKVSGFIIMLLGINNYEEVPSLLHLKSEINLLQNLFPFKNNASRTPQESQPYAKTVTGEVSHLEFNGLISTNQRKIMLTAKGKHIFSLLEKKAKPYTIKKIREFKELLNDLEHDELLAFMYYYPYKHDDLQHTNYRQILSNRKFLARSMYKKGKISAQKAAQIAEEHLEDFIKSM